MLKKKYYTGLQIHEAIDGVVGDYKKAIEIYRRLAKMETDDLVSVVRCKDCKHWGMHKSLNVPWCFEMHIDKSEDGYCDIGERREDAQKAD